MPVYPAGTRAKAAASYLDAGGERGPFSMWVPVITAANEEDQSGFWADWLTAAQALVLGARVKDKYVDETTYAVGRPTNGAAREIALKLIFRSAGTGQTWNSYLPTLNQALVQYIANYGAKDVVNMAAPTAVATFVTATNALTPKNPYDPTYADNGTLVGLQVVRGFK